jgi:hypothetical protein
MPDAKVGVDQEAAMRGPYEFPDDPEVFARVLEHFRNTSADYWDARVEQYAREARAQSRLSQPSSAAGIQVIRQEPKSQRKTAKGSRPHKNAGQTKQASIAKDG